MHGSWGRTSGASARRPYVCVLTLHPGQARELEALRWQVPLRAPIPGHCRLARIAMGVSTEGDTGCHPCLQLSLALRRWGGMNA